MTRTQTLFVLLTSTTLLGCDVVDDHAAPLLPAAVHGLGELGELDALDPSPVSSSASSPAQLGFGPVAEAGQTTVSASVGLPPREQDAIGWLRWVSSMPLSTGPLADPTGEQCGEGQSGPVFYLGGTLGGDAARSCTVPVGKTLVFPLINMWTAMPDSHFPSDADKQAYIDEIAALSDFVVDSNCGLTATLDGVALYADTDDTWVSTLDPFEVELPDDPDNIAAYFGLVGGTTDVIGGGYYARLPPLPPGEYELELGGALCSGGEPFFAVEVSYALTIQ